MENYKLELTGFIKSKYLDMNTEIQNMESKLKEICNDGRYNQSYMQRALREMNNNIKKILTWTKFPFSLYIVWIRELSSLFFYSIEKNYNKIIQ